MVQIIYHYVERNGFFINPYVKCIANKSINGHQCTIVWYIDDAKVSHCDLDVVKEIIGRIETKFGKMNPVEFQRIL